MTHDDAVAAHALARGFVTASQLQQARERVALLRRAGMPGDLLGALAPALRPDQLAELRGVAAGDRAASPAAATLAPSARPAERDVPAAGRAPARSLLPQRQLQPGDRVGPYVILRELGRGGMGVVFAAEHAELRRPVALKLRLALPGGDPRHEQRFLLEGQAAARLRHPGIVPVHDAGRDDAGRLWIAMDYVEGEALDRRVERQGPLDPREVARLGADVARALEHAHEQGVLHRDLKPANVLLRARDGAALVTDFGLAKVVTGAESLTRTGEVLGTPSFMAPEQAAGREVDGRADVWSLGATLYHLLVGHPPFQGEGVVGTLAAVLRGEVEPPRAARPDVPPDLEAVVLRCLSKDLARRYPSARALAEDLERVLAGESTEAEALARTRRRRVLAVGLAAALLLGGTAAGLVALALAPVKPAPIVPQRPDPVQAPEPDPELAPAPDPEVALDAEPVAEPAPEITRPEDGFLVTRDGLWTPALRDPTATRPAPRMNAGALVFDPRRRVMILFGGRDRVRTFDDQWVWDGAEWKDETPAVRPSARYCQAMAYDEARGRLVLHGGAVLGHDVAVHADTWELADGRWERRDAGGGPGLRGWHQMVYDPRRGRVLVFGGLDGRGEPAAELWAWDGERWERVDEGPAPGPGPRRNFAMAWDTTRDVLVLYGAASGPEMSEHWEWHPERGWTRRDAEGGPGNRSAAGLVATPRGLILFAGGGPHPRNDTWTFDGERWTRRLEGLDRGFLPKLRVWHTMGWDAHRQVVVLFGGGVERRGVLDDTWELSPDW